MWTYKYSPAIDENEESEEQDAMEGYAETEDVVRKRLGISVDGVERV